VHCNWRHARRLVWSGFEGVRLGALGTCQWQQVDGLAFTSHRVYMQHTGEVVGVGHKSVRTGTESSWGGDLGCGKGTRGVREEGPACSSPAQGPQCWCLVFESAGWAEKRGNCAYLCRPPPMGTSGR